MSKLEEIKEAYAKEKGYLNWETCINDQPNYKVESMMDEVHKIHLKAKLEESAEKFNNRYAISLVFRKTERSTEVILLRSLSTNARSEEEALEKAIKYFEAETLEYSLGMKTVIPANDKQSITETPLD